MFSFTNLIGDLSQTNLDSLVFSFPGLLWQAPYRGYWTKAKSMSGEYLHSCGYWKIGIKLLQCGSKLTKTFPFRIFGGIFRVRNILCLSYLWQFHPFRSPYPSLSLHPFQSALLYPGGSRPGRARLCSVIKTSCWSRLDILITSYTITLTPTQGSQMNQD